MNFTTKLSMLCLTAGLTACATTTDPAKQQKLISEQQNYEKTAFNVIHTDKVDNIDLVLRQRKINHSAEKKLATEAELVIVKRGNTAKAGALSGLLILTSVASAVSGGYVPVHPSSGFSKEQLKGKKIEPHVKNPTLDYARPIFNQWIKANASQLSPTQKPLQKVSVESNRFALIYEKLVGKEAYQLYNELHISFHNDWDNRKAFTHKCEMRSPAKALPEWQANQYQAINQAVQSNLQQCIDDLDKNKARIIKALTPKA